MHDIATAVQLHTDSNAAPAMVFYITYAGFLAVWRQPDVAWCGASLPCTHVHIHHRCHARMNTSIIDAMHITAAAAAAGSLRGRPV